MYVWSSKDQTSAEGQTSVKHQQTKHIYCKLPVSPEPCCRQAQVLRDMASGGGSTTAEGNGNDGGVRAVLLALADAVVGAEAMEELFAAVSLLASANDLVNGKIPSRRIARGEVNLEVDVDDF